MLLQANSREVASHVATCLGLVTYTYSTLKIKCEHFNNVITFQLPDKSFLRLHDKTSYLEIQVRHHTRDLCISYHPKVFPVLSQYFEDVCKKLNFNHKFQYGFLCHDGIKVMMITLLS